MLQKQLYSHVHAIWPWAISCCVLPRYSLSLSPLSTLATMLNEPPTTTLLRQSVRVILCATIHYFAFSIYFPIEIVSSKIERWTNREIKGEKKSERYRWNILFAQSESRFEGHLVRYARHGSGCHGTGANVSIPVTRDPYITVYVRITRRTDTSGAHRRPAVGLIHPYKLHKAVCRRFLLKIRRCVYHSLSIGKNISTCLCIYRHDPTKC